MEFYIDTEKDLAEEFSKGLNPLFPARENESDDRKDPFDPCDHCKAPICFCNECEYNTLNILLKEGV